MKKLVIRGLFIIILTCLFYIVITYIINSFNIFLKYTNILLTELFCLFLIFYNNKKLKFYTYILCIIIIMFFRIEKDYKANISTDFYLFKWLRIMFNNKVVFVNIIGNICIFIPLPIFLNNYIKNKYLLLIISIMIIIILEITQVITKRGIFDIIDIILNSIGVLVGYLLNIIYTRWIHERRKEEERFN